MNNTLLLTLIATIALSAAFLAWFAIELGTTSLQNYRDRFTEKTGIQVRDFFLFIDPRKLFVANVAIMLLGFALTWMITGSWFVALIVLGGLTFLPRLVYHVLRNRRLRMFEEQLPDALMVLSGALRAGLGLTSAMNQLVIEAPAPLSQEFGLLLREQRMGLPLTQALSGLGRRMPTQTTSLVVSALRIANQTGGSLAETLERTAHTIRSRLAMEGKIRALTAQGKMQAWVVGLLPVFLLYVLNKMEPEAMYLLWHTRIGWGTLVVLAMLEFMGVYIIRKIIAIDV